MVRRFRFVNSKINFFLRGSYVLGLIHFVLVEIIICSCLIHFLLLFKCFIIFFNGKCEVDNSCIIEHTSSGLSDTF